MRELLSKGNDVTKAQQQTIDRQKAAIAEIEEANRRNVSLKQVFEQWRETALTPRIKTDGKRMGRKDGGKYVAEQFARHVLPKLGELPITNIRKSDVFVILDSLVASNRLRTANVILGDLKQLFRFAAEREIVEASPMEFIKKESAGGSDTERKRVLSEEEIQTLPTLIAAANLSKRTELVIWLILATGAPMGEKWFSKLRQRLKRNFRAQSEALVALANWSHDVEEKVVGCQAATA